jgi:hypothetical protein
LEIARGETFEGQLFDELSQGLAAGAISRRRALKLAGAAILGSTGLLALFPRAAGAQSIVSDGVSVAGHKNPGCQGERAISNRRCPFNICGREHYCVCAETVGGEKKCVNVDERCPRRDECDRNEDCARGEVCIKVGGCCGRPRRNDCVPLCG